MLESGVKPVYVFDGKPPQLKSGEVRQKHSHSIGIFSIEISSDLDLETGLIKPQLKWMSFYIYSKKKNCSCASNSL